MPELNGYDVLAREYYDDFHQTCRNFDKATATVLSATTIEIPNSGLVLEVGCGRGRCNEYLHVPPERIIQLDSSKKMLGLEPRESCLLKLHADATSIPLFDNQFAALVGFLIDPFIGLNFFSEAHRLLRTNGRFLATTPSNEWGSSLREENLLYANFIGKDSGETVEVASTLVSQSRIKEMLGHVGFIDVLVTPCNLPEGAKPISADIQKVASKKGISVSELPVIYLIQARKP
jgi:SAM-dependent methyltransferase